jgi:hypothetical protein
MKSLLIYLSAVPITIALANAEVGGMEFGTSRQSMLMREIMRKYEVSAQGPSPCLLRVPILRGRLRAQYAGSGLYLWRT